ncbi:hypothetical protein EG328_003415 [Venturia inaequalis]|uniref:Xylanolytic transcriptional activator regulatory domain-containing protein n=1 Tax=Venturia inaequalis TaxID=5025 RepID=A0A8H3V9G2_VENIN|nr:hypothetical protein EG328_003415 [Venturia inaequalis]KAE9983043.1 hypothetical protein EG327_005638 [Venturia inaequalis]
MLGTAVPLEEGEAPPKDEQGEPVQEETHEERIQKACQELRELGREKAAQDATKGPKKDHTEERSFGRLVVDEGRSRYINPSFWASLSDEVEDLKEILNSSDDDDDDDDNDYPSPKTSHPSPHDQGFMFGHSSQNVNMFALHPPKEHVAIYWQVYKENVDPLVKVIHAPTIEPTILKSADGLDKIHRGLECLLFAVYYGAITSMWPEEVRKLFGDEKLELLTRYRFGLEQALARAEFLQTDEIIVLQAFIIFLICLRRNDDARIIWTLTGLVVRMAQTLGLHRDGTHFALPPFQIEMRRRLWWQICILDARASEDHGCDPTIIDHAFDTQMPANVNDDELDPHMTELPKSKTGCTEMTFGLIRFEIASTLRKLQYVPPGSRKCNRILTEMSMEKKENWIKECHEKLESQYIKDGDMNVPLYWVIATVSRLIMSKMWLMVYHPFQRIDGGSSLPQEIRDKLFQTSVENVEYSLLLENEDRTKKWGWLFRTYVQWHAIAFLLSELCVRTEGESVERAWKAIDFVLNRRFIDDTNSHSTNKMKSHLWKPMKRLMDKARAARAKAVIKAQEEQRAKTKALQQAQAPLVTNAFDPVVPIMNLDFSVDRLFRGRTIGDSSTPLPDTSLDMTGFSLTSGFLADQQFPTAPPSVSIDQIMRPVQNDVMSGVSGDALPAQFDIGDDWLTNGLADVSTAGDSALLPDDDVDWANWDDMVNEYMQVDSKPPVDSGQTGAFNSTLNPFSQWY